MLTVNQQVVIVDRRQVLTPPKTLVGLRRSPLLIDVCRNRDGTETLRTMGRYEASSWTQRPVPLEGTRLAGLFS